ncbi:MAG TPA: twin-arginine translocase subunit TatC [Pseudonocardiaceae bacterium]
MTLIEHLYELRHRLTIAILAVLLGGVFGFIWFQFPVFGLPTLGTLLTDPYCSLPSTLRADISIDDSCQLLATAPFEAFMLQFKVGLTAGVVLASPIWLYQLWGFITPGLYAKERKYALSFVAIAAVLFVAGAMLAYLVVAKGLEVLLNFGGGQVITALTGDRYFSFILTMLLIFGVSFELPVLVVMLNRAGVLTYEKLRKWLRGIVMGLFVFAAVATPSQDPISMIALAGALTVLFLIALVIARFHDRAVARARLADGWDGLSDDEATPMDDYQAEPVEEPEPVRRSYDDAT